MVLVKPIPRDWSEAKRREAQDAYLFLLHEQAIRLAEATDKVNHEVFGRGVSWLQCGDAVDPMLVSCDIRDGVERARHHLAISTKYLSFALGGLRRDKRTP